MTLQRILICLAVIAAITLAADLVMSKYRADLVKSSMEYASLMDSIPAEFGDWTRTKNTELPRYALEQLKPSGAKNWTYVNEQTDEYVHVSFLVGPTGRLSVHTPEVCMDGQGYMISQERQREPFPDESDEDAENSDRGNSDNQDVFWRVAIANRAVPEAQIVSYYALGTGKRWWAKDNPRYELDQYPFILKIQVETAAPHAEGYNSARNFLKEFLPEIARVYAETDLQGKYGK
ncbi:MAG: EpsI family protein [Planctomycetaceae bacterium]|nr:EpsI family protein [Planctomycetaceae bacterium]